MKNGDDGHQFVGGVGSQFSGFVLSLSESSFQSKCWAENPHQGQAEMFKFPNKSDLLSVFKFRYLRTPGYPMGFNRLAALDNLLRTMTTISDVWSVNKFGIKYQNEGFFRGYVSVFFWSEQ